MKTNRKIEKIYGEYEQDPEKWLFENGIKTQKQLIKKMMSLMLEYEHENTDLIVRNEANEKENEYLTIIINSYGLRTKSRKRELLYLRYEFLYYCVKHLGLTLKYAGELIGKNHATVINAIKQRGWLIDTHDSEYKYLTNDIKTDLIKLFSTI